MTAAAPNEATLRLTAGTINHMIVQLQASSHHYLLDGGPAHPARLVPAVVPLHQRLLQQLAAVPVPAVCYDDGCTRRVGRACALTPRDVGNDALVNGAV